MRSPIGRSWDEFKKTLLTPEEREELDAKILLMSELIRARKAHGLTQKELGEHTGIKQPFIARIESGSTDPQLGTLLKILSALGKTLVISDRRDGGLHPQAEPLGSGKAASQAG